MFFSQQFVVGLVSFRFAFFHFRFQTTIYCAFDTGLSYFSVRFKYEQSLKCTEFCNSKCVEIDKRWVSAPENRNPGLSYHSKKRTSKKNREPFICERTKTVWYKWENGMNNSERSIGHPIAQKWMKFRLRVFGAK